LVKVVSPIDDTPAYRAGIQADVITRINRAGARHEPGGVAHAAGRHLIASAARRARAADRRQHGARSDHDLAGALGL
jgi:C-terminal processing protease CtpA/Prc